MSEIVEAVAKAIADEQGSNFDALPKTQGPGFGLRNMYLHIARVAIEAYEAALINSTMNTATGIKIMEDQERKP